jgi:hypothetical protein
MVGNRELKIPLSEIEPFGCQRPQDAKRYLAMLREALAVLVEQHEQTPALIWAQTQIR